MHVKLRRIMCDVSDASETTEDGRGDGPTYVQVSQTVSDPAVLTRQLATLRAIPDHYPRLLLTTDPGSADHDGITRRCVYDWLLDN